MSAWLCSDEHHKQLACWLCNDDRSGLEWLARMTEYQSSDRWMEANDLATHIANILKKENARSLSARYDERADEYWNDKDDAIPPITLGEVHRMQQCDLGRIAKATDCYEYQACESDDFHETMAWHILGYIRKEALKRLPGYEKANWGKPVEFTEPAPEIYSLTKALEGSRI